MAGTRLVFQIIIFAFLLNVSTGIMMHLIPDLFLTGEYNNGLNYDENQIQDINTFRNQTITPSSQLNSGDGFFTSLLDAITGGYFSKISNFVSDGLWGFPNMLENIFGSYMDDSLRIFIFDGLRAILGLMYVFCIIWMFSGRNLLKESL